LSASAIDIAREGLKYGYTDHAAVSIANGESISQFRTRLMIAGAAMPTAIGMSRSELARYSLSLGIAAAADKHLAIAGRGLEGEIHQELLKRQAQPLNPHTLLVPIDVIQHHAKAFQTRADIVGTTTAGGYMVETENLGFVGLALPRSVVGLLGVQKLEGLVGNVDVPVFKAAGTFTDMATETTQAATASQTFGQVALTPRTEGVYYEVSRLLLRQTDPSTQAFLAKGMLAAFAARLELLLLQGSGIAGQPQGLISAATGSVSGSSLALAGVLSFQTALGDRLNGNGAFLTTQAVAAVLAARQKGTSTSSYLWEGPIFAGALNGVPAFTTSNIPTGKMIFGAWDYALMASWGDLKIEVNPFANFQAGTVGMRILHDVDVAALDPAAFAVAASVT
jgi:HK97 family phage major capsid protein